MPDDEDLQRLYREMLYSRRERVLVWPMPGRECLCHLQAGNRPESRRGQLRQFLGRDGV